MKSEQAIRERLEMYDKMDRNVGLSDEQKTRYRELRWVLSDDE